MNKIDFSRPLAEQYRYIDFDTFESDDIYVLISVGKYPPRIHYYTARVEHFRQGIAIAHTQNCNYLINTHCEILRTNAINTPRHIANVQVQRALNGFKVSWEEECSAPGKDFDWQDKETYITEDSLLTLAQQSDNPSIYPSCNKEGIPYERGKCIKYGNKIYDFETYLPLFSVPPTLHIFKREIINNRFFKNKIADKEINDGEVFNEADFNKFIIKDTQYYRNLIVEVYKNKITSFYPFPVIDEGPLKDISYQNYTEGLEIRSFEGLEGDKYANYLFDDEKKELRHTIGDKFNLFKVFPDLRDYFKAGELQHIDILHKYGKDCLVYINKRRDHDRLLIRFIRNGFMIRLNSSYRNYSKYYVFNCKGDLLNTKGYDEVDVANNNLMFRRGKDYGIGSVGIYNVGGEVELREKIIYTCNSIEEATLICGDKQKNFRIGLTCRNADYVDDHLHCPYYKRNLEMEKAAAICIYSWKSEGLGFRPDYTNSVFYAGIPYVLKKENIDEVLPLEPIIENYLYKLPNNRVVDRNSILFPFWYREFEYCMYSIDKIKYATEEAIKKTQHSLLENCRAANPYITNIKEIKKLGNYFLFEYRPIGKIDSHGNITYEFGDPQDIKL